MVDISCDSVILFYLRHLYLVCSFISPISLQIKLPSFLSCLLEPHNRCLLKSVASSCINFQAPSLWFPSSQYSLDQGYTDSKYINSQSGNLCLGGWGNLCLTPADTCFSLLFLYSPYLTLPWTGVTLMVLDICFPTYKFK